MKYLKFITILLLFSATYLMADELPPLEEVLPFLNQEDLNTLTTEGQITWFHGDSFIPQYIPECSLQSTILANYSYVDVNLGIEGLFLYKGIEAEDLAENQDEYMLLFMNIFSSISTLQGIEYWSASRETMRTLFAESWLIESLENPVRVDDPTYTEMPFNVTVYAHQRDLTFGSSESSIIYNGESDCISMSILNETDMWYTIIRVMKKNNMHIDLVVLPTADGILYYGISAAETLKVEAVQEKASNSLYNRVVAFNHWFINQLESKTLQNH